MEQMTCALNIMRRLPPQRIEANVTGLTNLMPDLTEELLQRIDQPLKIAKDSSGKLYLECDYNRDGDSYRSPWTNKFYPPLNDAMMPPAWLRSIEEKANFIFDEYRKLYYEGGVSSVYLWDLSEDESATKASNFAGCFIIKKEIIEQQRRVSQGCWDSIHVVGVQVLPGGMAEYTLTTSIMLTMTSEKGNAGAVNLSGSLTRQLGAKKMKATSDDDHVINMGKIIEEMEAKVRDDLDKIRIQKTKEIIAEMRKPHNAAAGEHGTLASGAGAAAHMGDLQNAVNRRGTMQGGVALPGLPKKN